MSLEAKEETEPEKLLHFRWLIHSHILFLLFVIMVRADGLTRFIDGLARLRLVKALNAVSIYVMPLTAVLGVGLIVFSITTYFDVPGAREVARSAGPLGTSATPFLAGFAAVIIAISAHELGHAVMARSLNLSFKVIGFVALSVPFLGFTTEIDKKELANLRNRDSVKVPASGPTTNLTVAVISLVALILVVASLAPITSERGVGIAAVLEGLPAESVGLIPGDIIIAVNGQQTPSPSEFSTLLLSSSAGDRIDLTYARGDRIITTNVELAQRDENSSRGILGVFVTRDPIRSLELFSTLSLNTLQIYLVIPTFGAGQTFAPYSETMSVFYSSPLGQAYLPLASLFFWIWFINLIIAIFESLPIFIRVRWHLYLDGGMFLRNALTSVTKGEREGFVRAVTWIISGIMLLSLIALVILPYIL